MNEVNLKDFSATSRYFFQFVCLGKRSLARDSNRRRRARPVPLAASCPLCDGILCCIFSLSVVLLAYVDSYFELLIIFLPPSIAHPNKPYKLTYKMEYIRYSELVKSRRRFVCSRVTRWTHGSEREWKKCVRIKQKGKWRRLSWLECASCLLSSQ